MLTDAFCLICRDLTLRLPERGHSSVGRAPALQAGGRRFDPVWLHQPCAAEAAASQGEAAFPELRMQPLVEANQIEIRSQNSEAGVGAISGG